MYWDKAAWKNDDKQWQQERKAEWKKIQFNLKFFRRTLFDGNYVSAHKNLFLKGECDEAKLEQYGGKEFHYALPLFLLWYHPDPTEAVINDLLSFHCENTTRALNIGQCRQIVSDLEMQTSHNMADDYSLFGGREELIARTLWGEPIIGAVFDNLPAFKNQRKKPVTNSGSGLIYLYGGSVEVALCDGNRGRYKTGHFLMDHYLAYEKPLDDSTMSVIKGMANRVIHFEKSTYSDKENPHSLRIREQHMELFRAKALSPEIQQVWEEVANSEPFFLYG